MTRYFLAPRSGEKSYQNFLSTVKHGVPFSRIEPHLSDEGKKVLKSEEIIYSWGNREGKKNEWGKMNNGDIVIFYAHGELVMAGNIIFKQHSPQLALAMWPPDENGQPWSYTFFLNNLRYFKIPLSHFNLVSGYSFRAVMGFQEITAPYRDRILSHYKDFNALFDTFSDAESVEIPKADERVYVNINSQVSPEISNKVIVKYEPSAPTDSKRKKKTGYVDFDEVNRHRAKIGSLGEEVVLRFERNRLRASGRVDLADKVRQLSLEDTYAGYDIVSYHENGDEIKIEVKATVIEQPENFSFNISKNERMVAENSDNYFIYLVYGVNTSTPKVHIVKNPFKNGDHLVIEPVNFIVRGRFSDNDVLTV